MSAMNKILRVLVVEDSGDDAELIRNQLTEAGFAVLYERVESAASLEVALEHGSWDMVICDHNLPAFDSLAALEIVQKMTENLPLIIVSGLIPDEVAIEAMRRGARDFIHKSNLSKLALVVERELQEAMVRADLNAARLSLHNVSHFDSLTGLPNREHLFEHLSEKMSCTVQDHPFAVFLIDLNRFRQVTKSFGMWAGNKVLVEMAERLRVIFGENSFVARLGADTFVAVVPHLEQEAQAEYIAKAIHKCMDEVFRIDDYDLFVNASVGVSFYPKDGQDWDSLFRNAESALYHAKATGGSSYQTYKSELDVYGKERLVMESALHHALAHDEYVLHYQPQFDLSSGRIVGVEALLRWRRSAFGLIQPGKFIPILEETGLIVPVGEWVLRTACAQNKRWQDEGLSPVCIAVNLSVIQFRQPRLVQTIKKILNETGLLPQYLELEITENIAMHTEEETIAVLNELRAIGVQISIDDFGTGYSSLSYLKRFPIDKLKIDQSFVRDHQEGSNDDGIVVAIIGMGHGLNLKVIAEGVETQAQADFLKLNGCDEVQGYFYGKPMNVSDLALLMEKTTACSNNEFCEAMV